MVNYPKKVSIGICVALGLVTGAAGPVAATATNFSWSDPNSDFKVKKGSTCSLASGFAFSDDNNYSFDVGGLVVVGGTTIGQSATDFDLTTVGSDALAVHPTTGTETIGTLGVTVSHRMTSGNIVRTLVSITNNDSSPQSTTVAFVYDFGDDFGIYHLDGASWRNAGDWFVTGEEPSSYTGSLYYPSVFNAIDGPGSPEVMGSISDCLGSPLDTSSTKSEEMIFSYSITIPPGETRRILIFQGFDNQNFSTLGAKAKAEAFDPRTQTPGSGLLSDLTDVMACEVVNWDFSVCGGGGSQVGDYDFDDYRLPTETASGPLPDTR